MRPNTQARARHHDQRGRSEEASVPAGDAAARVLHGRQRGGLVECRTRGSPRRAYAIAHTPFTDTDEIDATALQRAVDWAFTVGADGLGTGMVSETFKLTHDERLSLAKMLVEFAAGRGPVFAAVGAESTKQSLGIRGRGREGRAATRSWPCRRSTGAAHARRISSITSGPWPTASRIPVIVQDASGYVGQSIPIRVCVKLLETLWPGEDPLQARGRAERPDALRAPRRDRRPRDDLRGLRRHLPDRQLPPRHRRHDAGDGICSTASSRSGRHSSAATRRRPTASTSRSAPSLPCNCKPGSTGSWRSRST